MGSCCFVNSLKPVSIHYTGLVNHYQQGVPEMTKKSHFDSLKPIYFEEKIDKKKFNGCCFTITFIFEYHVALKKKSLLKGVSRVGK